MTQYLTPRDIDEFADQIKTNYLECRVHGHQRMASSAGPISDVVSGLPAGDDYLLKTLRCRNKCGIVWREVVSNTTGLVIGESKPDYSQAPLYLTKGMGRLTKNDKGKLRLEHLHRWLESQEKSRGK